MLPAGPGADGSDMYERIGYYDSASQTVDNLVFLGNHGGQGSGVFTEYVHIAPPSDNFMLLTDLAGKSLPCNSAQFKFCLFVPYKALIPKSSVPEITANSIKSAFGASLSYVNNAGTAGASSPQKLADTTIPSASEIAVMLGEACGADDCGYFQPGSVAYRKCAKIPLHDAKTNELADGFGGADKVFLMEFGMPMDPGSYENFESDMPAVWMLNAQIPRTTQYGPADCNCWVSGCGEFDIAEALFQGSTYLKTTLHGTISGGDSDYFDRPASGTMKLAVVFSSSSSTIHVQVLPHDTAFNTTLTAGELNAMCEVTPGNQVSHFAIT